MHTEIKLGPTVPERGLTFAGGFLGGGSHGLDESEQVANERILETSSSSTVGSWIEHLLLILRSVVPQMT